MPASVDSDAKRSPALLTVLFWIGVGLAPLAALILLIADGNGPLRFAAVLAIVAVVLIGLSIALRPGGDSGQAREELLDELDQLRQELRGEIVAAAQRGNQALDQAQRAQEAIVAVRRRLDATGAALAGAEDPVGAGRARVPVAEPAEDVPPGRARAAGPEDAAPRRGRADWDDDEDSGRRAQPDRYGGDRAPAGQYGTARPPAGEYGAERSPAGGYGGGDRPAPAQSGTYGGAAQVGAYGSAASAGVYGAAARPAEHEARPEPGHRGVVRHTETVHVTTRHTIVDGGPAEPAGGRYGGGYSGSWSPTSEDRQWGAGRQDEPSWSGPGAGPEDRSWSGYAGSDERARPGDERQWAGQPRRRDEADWEAQRDDRQRDDRGWDGARDDRAWDGRRDERSWSGSDDQPSWTDQAGAGEGGWAAPAERGGQDRPQRPDDTGAYWAQLRSGDRWAAVRDDENGRELRVGERRAEVHADATGTEFRVADRWASVRREEPRREWDEPRRDYDRGGDEGWRGGWSEPEERAALPAGGVPVPDEWRPPRQRGYQSTADAEPERVGRRARHDEERYGYPPQDDAPRAGGARPGDRWR